MSPERGNERAVSGAIAAAQRRARLLAAGEAVLWGVAVAAVSTPAGVAVAIAVGVWRRRSTRRASIVRALEHAHPESRNLFVTAVELADGGLIAKPAIRARVFADAAAGASGVDLRTVFPMAPLVRIALLACLTWTTVEAAHLWRGQLSQAGFASGSRSPSSSRTASTSRLRVNVEIEPPAYTGIKATAVVDPEQVQAIQGSTLTVSVESPASGVTVEHDGRRRSLTRGADGRFTGRMPLDRTGYLLVAADEGARRMVPIVVSPDALPAVRITAPGRDLVYAGGNPQVAFDARATDDFGLRSLALRYTKVSGSGENFEFHDGEIPLAVSRANARDWRGSAVRSLAELNLKDGDMLVYRAVASDTRPGDGSASSDAFFIEISKLGVAAGDAFTLPEEETRYALSQQMLIVKTERLQRRRGSDAPGELNEQALNLAVEQRMIRAEFVFMLGGEVENEEVEAAQSTELQEGRLQNRGQRDVRAATVAMSQAEQLLTGADTAGALIAERAAVTALQRAFARGRYILRALATRSQLDPARRLTGSLPDAAGWRRNPPDVPENRRAALLQDLVRGIADLVSRAGASRQRALVLAEEAIRIDPAAALLRQTATELQRAADAAGDPAGQSRALAAAAAAAVAEARRAHADAPLPSSFVAPALSGAFADALANARLKASRSNQQDRR